MNSTETFGVIIEISKASALQNKQNIVEVTTHESINVKEESQHHLSCAATTNTLYQWTQWINLLI